MVIKFNSEISEDLAYDIYINNAYIQSVYLSTKQTTQTVVLHVNDLEFELTIIPKRLKKIYLLDLFKKIILLPLTLFLFWVTWESFLVSEKAFYLQSKKTMVINNQRNGEVEFNIVCGHVNNTNDIYCLKINITDVKNLKIQSQSSNLIKDYKSIRHQLYEWLLFYFLLFLPAYALFVLLFCVSTKSLFYILSICTLLIIFVMAQALLVFRCFKIFARYRKYLYGLS